MKKKNILAALFAAIVFTLVGCSTDEFSSPEVSLAGGTPIQLADISVASSSGDATRYAIDPASGTQPWENGDKVLVTAIANGTYTTVKNYYTYDGSAWVQNTVLGTDYTYPHRGVDGENQQRGELRRQAHRC